MPQSEMAKKLHVSRSTIARDISELRHEAGNWMEGITKDYGYMIELKTELDRLQDVMYNLIKLRDKETKSSVIIQINKAIASISEKRFDLYTTTPMAESFKKFVKKEIQNSKKPNSNNRYFLPVYYPEMIEELDRQDERKEKELKERLESKGIKYLPVEDRPK